MASVSTNPIPVQSLTSRQAVGAICIELGMQDFVNRNNLMDFDAPQNTILKNGDINVLTAFDSGTTDAITVGDDLVANRYLASTSVKATGVTALTPTGFKTDGHSPAFRITRTPSGTAATVGLLRFTCMFVTVNKTDWTEGVY